MAYSIFEQINNDFDILLFDGTKLIHLATAGGLLPSKLNEYDIDFRLQIREVYRYRRTFKFVQNNELIRDNLHDQKHYFSFFNYMAKRGFYSYDKVFIDNIEDQTYQLISKPNYDRDINLATINKKIELPRTYKYSLMTKINLIETSKEFPKSYESFNIEEFL